MQSPNETIPQSGHTVTKMDMLASSLDNKNNLETEIRCFVDSEGNVLPIEVPATSEQQHHTLTTYVGPCAVLDEASSQNTEIYTSSTQRWACKKGCSARPNNWGGPTYTELITNAILSAPQQRLTLSQIYNCLVQQVEYFRERKNYNSSQGWKNAIRHTLSVRKRFTRVKRRSGSTGWYNSWWTLDRKFVQKKNKK